MKKVFIAMSGGVDSSVAAYLLKQQGYDCTGVTMNLNPCGSSRDIEDAQSVARSLGFAHRVFDLPEDFKKDVIEPFIKAYRNALTPNPCVICNRRIKFGRFFEYAKKLGADYIATGHYARIGKDPVSGGFLLKKAADASKDQSYVLYTLTGEQLKSVLFPLGTLTKKEVREIAAAQGFANADRRDSQDICFVPGGDYAGFIKRYTGENPIPGDFTDTDGNVLGRHKGLIHYTVGQRKGLGLSLPESMYVLSKNLQNNTIILCKDNQLYTDTFTVADLILHADRSGPPYTPFTAGVKIRYSHTEQPALVTQISGDSAKIVFDKPQRAITPGQAAVLYSGGIVLGGGTITPFL